MIVQHRLLKEVIAMYINKYFYTGAQVGSIIKLLAKLLLVFGVVGSVLVGLTLTIQGFVHILTQDELIAIGMSVLVLGSIVSITTSALMYGFGELIERTQEIAKNTRGGEMKSEEQYKVDSERINTIERLRSKGMITEEEYRQAISKEQ